MDKDLKKVVILLAHPNMKESQANKALTDAVKDMDEVAVYNLYELHNESTFNVDEWSKIISHAAAVIYQFPFYWMSAPSLLKKWQDEVFTYLAKTPAVAGKPLMVVTTTGSEFEAYRWRKKSLYRRRITTTLSSRCYTRRYGVADTDYSLRYGNNRCCKKHSGRSKSI